MANGRLASVSYDAERRRWFDLDDHEGHSLRLMSPITVLSGKEATILWALRDHVRECHLKVDLDTRRALGLHDYLP
jgi:hypothetical protein